MRGDHKRGAARGGVPESQREGQGRFSNASFTAQDRQWKLAGG
jgi:hypothetical protein